MFKFLAAWTLGEGLSFKCLSCKLTLLAFLSGQRVQTLKALTLSSMTLSATKCIFTIGKTLKTTRPGHHLKPIEFLAHQADQNFCVVRHLQIYTDRTSSLRGDAVQLLIGYQKPHKPVATNTISRWIQTVLTNAGIDTGVYKAHSTRAAATSAANKKQVSIETILSATGWRNMNTFAQFYFKPILDNVYNFGRELLKDGHD